MKAYRIASFAALFAMLVSSILAGAANAAPAAQGGSTRQIAAARTVTLRSLRAAAGTATPRAPGQLKPGGPGQGPKLPPRTVPYRGAQHATPGQGAGVRGSAKTKSNPELQLSFDGLNSIDQAAANNGNQLSLEPPDQGLCAGNGFVLETINDVLSVYDTSGNSLTGPVDLNTFYGYAPQYNYATREYGPFITDPSCLFDGDTQRWFHIAETIDQHKTTGAFLGPNHLDIAVSQTPDPTQGWTIYRIPTQNNGTQGTPDHSCSQGYCFGDYPHWGADATGFYVTTDEYSLFGPEFKSAIIYAFSKRQLAANLANINVTELDTTGAYSQGGHPGYVVWPAQAPSGIYDRSQGGTEYFMSADAAFEATGVPGGTASTHIFVWRLTNTSSLDSTPALSLSNSVIRVGTYVNPPLADQKAGDIPLASCLNDPNCGYLLTNDGKPDPYVPEVLGQVATNDATMTQVTYANGNLWSALNTAVRVGGVNKAGIEWFIVNPKSDKLVKNGYTALANNNVMFPAITVTKSGRGVMAMSLSGADYYPSAAYASIDSVAGAGDIHVAAQGVGPTDGFTEYKAYGGGVAGPRWGDYGGAIADGNTVWIASEYIGQTCTYAQWLLDPSCGFTRWYFTNWYTRVSKLTP